MSQKITVLESGRLEMGVTKVPFSFIVKGQKENALLDTYHGAYVSVNYVVKVQVERGEIYIERERFRLTRCVNILLLILSENKNNKTS